SRRCRQSQGGCLMLRLVNLAVLRQAAALAVLLALWEAAGRAHLLNPLYMPSPSQIATALGELFGSGRIWPHLEATFVAALGGLASGTVVGIMLGAKAARVPVSAVLFRLAVQAPNAIPW